MLWTAIGWLHNDNSFDEGRFLMSMTALEAMVEHVIRKSLTTIMPKEDFGAVKTKLLEALAASSLDGTSRQIFEGKVKGLNGRTLSQKIQALRDHYGLSKAIFTDEAIVEIIKSRNALLIRVRVRDGARSGRRLYSCANLFPTSSFTRYTPARMKAI